MTSRSQTAVRRQRRWLRALLWLFAAYVVVVFMFGFLQRSFIYFPTREAPIEPSDAGLPPGQVHPVSVRAADQVELHGWHVLADGHSATSRAECDGELAAGRHLVVYFSGNAGNRRFRPDEFGIFTSLGADVFIFDYRGYGDNSGSPSEDRLADDARAVWNYATRERQVRPDRIILYGESLGGGVAVRLAAELSQADAAPAGLIIRSTFSSLVDVGRYHYPLLPVRLALVDRFDSAGQVPQLTSPLLQIHGTRDAIIPIELGLRLFRAAPQRASNGMTKQFVKLPNAGHNDVTLAAKAELRAAIQAFLEQLPREP